MPQKSVRTPYSLWKSLYFQGIFMPYDPLILLHILGAYFLLIWGAGVVKDVFKNGTQGGWGIRHRLRSSGLRRQSRRVHGTFRMKIASVSNRSPCFFTSCRSFGSACGAVCEAFLLSLLTTLGLERVPTTPDPDWKHPQGTRPKRRSTIYTPQKDYQINSKTISVRGV